jgi:hypothetical protein
MSTPSPPGYASDPQLIMLWTAPPDLTGKEVQASGSGSMPPESMPFAINLATLQAAQQAMLDAGSAVVDAYNPLEQKVQEDISSGIFFGEYATYNMGEADTPLQDAARQFAAQMYPAMSRVLRLMADGMSTVGAYIAMLNNAGQMYTGSDKSSAVPPPGAPGGGS